MIFMAKKETISIIIPTLNEEKIIGNCLDSLLEQTKKPLEVIIIDNGSADKTLSTVKSYISKFKMEKIALKIFLHAKGNQTNARDFGVRKSRGSIIGSLDADACPDKNWVSSIIKNLKDQKIIGIGGKSRFRNKGFLFNLGYIAYYYLRPIIGLYCIGGGNSAFRKDAFLKVRGYNGLEELRKKKKIYHAKDDFFLSKKFEQIGKIRFCPDMNVTLLSRVRKNRDTAKTTRIGGIIKRVFFEIIDDRKITLYIKSIKKNKK